MIWARACPIYAMSALKLFATAVMCLACLPVKAAENYRLQAPEEVYTLLHTYLPDAGQEIAADDESARLGLVRRLREQTRDLLATEGYFSPQVSLEGGEVPILNVVPGPRTKVSSLELSFTGELATQDAFRAESERFRAEWALKVGEVFRDRDWAQAKEHLLQQVAARHFAGARIAESQADIDPERAEAHLHLTLDSGPAYRFGELNVEGLRDYSPALLERYNILQRGGEYSLESLQALQAALQTTPYFSYVEVSADVAQAKGNVLPVKVLVQEAKPKRFTVGVGYSSNTGAKFDLGLRDANLLGQAWLLNSGLRLETKQQSAFADVFLPPDADGWRNSVGGIAEASYISGLRLRRQTAGVARSIQLGDITTRFGLSLQGETTQADGAERSHKQALAFDWQWTRRKLDNPLDPHRGNSVSLRLSAASRYLLSDTDFVRTWSRLAWWYPFSSQDVLGLRVEGGYTVAKSRSDVPQDFLFRTGGAQSVRGYNYLSLGAHEGLAVVGGRYMGTGSMEYTHWLAASPWGIAGFVDVGDAGDQLNALRAHVGSGLGGRWRSPAGPLALDLAYGWQDRRLRLHLSVALVF